MNMFGKAKKAMFCEMKYENLLCYVTSVYIVKNQPSVSDWAVQVP